MSALIKSGDTPDLSQYRTIKGLIADHGDLFSEFQIRWALRNRKENGLNDAVTRFGRTLYIHVPTFTRVFAERGK